jgi:16S rRNA processing protein RimM
MHTQPLVKIGKVNSTHGVKGEVTITHLLSDVKEFKSWPAVMIEIMQGSFIPYFIESYKVLGGSELLVKFDDIHSKETARDITGCNIYASPLVTVKSLIQNQWTDIIGYAILNNNIVVGNVAEVTAGVGQDYFKILNKDKEILIPIQDTFIKNIDAVTQQIFLELPEGFLEIFG